MNTHLLKLPAIASVLLIVSSTMLTSASNAQTAPPPSLGEETKGTPAVEEPVTTEKPANAAETVTPDDSVDSTVAEQGEENSNIFGRSTVVESRRENGQIYSIELRHSNAPTQYIEETDSDGDIESTPHNIEETPNLPKWKIGSW